MSDIFLDLVLNSFTSEGTSRKRPAKLATRRSSEGCAVISCESSGKIGGLRLDPTSLVPRDVGKMMAAVGWRKNAMKMLLRSILECLTEHRKH